MSLLFRRKREGPDRRRSLAGVAVVNDNVSFAKNEDGNTVVFVTLHRGEGWLSRFQPSVMKRRVELDELGTFVIAQIDGESTVVDIIDAFVERFRTTRREAELSVAAFLKSLVSRRVISILVK